MVVVNVVVDFDVIKLKRNLIKDIIKDIELTLFIFKIAITI